MDQAKALGILLELVVAHGLPAVQDAVDALEQGKATPTQQKICFQIIKAVAP